MTIATQQLRAIFPFLILETRYNAAIVFHLSAKH